MFKDKSNTIFSSQTSLEPLLPTSETLPWYSCVHSMEKRGMPIGNIARCRIAFAGMRHGLNYLFCCHCGKIPWPRRLTEKRVCWGLRFEREEFLRLGSHGTKQQPWWRVPEAEHLHPHCKHRTETAQWEWHEASWPQSPPSPVTYILL